jgi:hypothetical protein
MSVNSNGAPYGSLRFMKLFRSTGSRSRTRRSSVGIGLVAAVLFAVVPAVQAYCGIELPAGTPATYAAETDDAEHRTPCCDAFPEAAIDDRASPEDSAPLVGKAPVAALPLARGTTAAVFAALQRRTWYDLPPPEPMFRRLPRLLL